MVQKYCFGTAVGAPDVAAYGGACTLSDSLLLVLASLLALRPK